MRPARSVAEEFFGCSEGLHSQRCLALSGSDDEHRGCVVLAALLLRSREEVREECAKKLHAMALEAEEMGYEVSGTALQIGCNAIRALPLGGGA